MTDDGYKLVLFASGSASAHCRYGRIQRLQHSTQPGALRRLDVANASAFSPNSARPEPPEFWCGLRPSTPSNVPFIGRSVRPNLYLNTGHGTLGWTMACGAGTALADIVSGRKAGNRIAQHVSRWEAAQAAVSAPRRWVPSRQAICLRLSHLVFSSPSCPDELLVRARIDWAFIAILYRLL